MFSLQRVAYNLICSNMGKFQVKETAVIPHPAYASSSQKSPFFFFIVACSMSMLVIRFRLGNCTTWRGNAKKKNDKTTTERKEGKKKKGAISFNKLTDNARECRIFAYWDMPQTRALVWDSISTKSIPSRMTWPTPFFFFSCTAFYLPTWISHVYRSPSLSPKCSKETASYPWGRLNHQNNVLLMNGSINNVILMNGWTCVSKPPPTT